MVRGSKIFNKDTLENVHKDWENMRSYWREWERKICSVQFSSAVMSDSLDSCRPGLPVHHQLPELAWEFIEWVMPPNHLILCHPLLLMPSIFPSIMVFSNESALHIRWPKYWSFSFSISPSNEYSGLISFRIDWFDLLAVQGTLKSLLQHHGLKACREHASLPINRKLD